MPNLWHIFKSFHVSLLKPYKGDSPSSLVEEDPPKFEEDEEVLLPKRILKHEDKVLRIGKVLQKHLVKFQTM